LRIGTQFRRPHVMTYFQFPNDRGDFSRVMLRCVGVGNCRQHGHQTMCPSYRVTREERNSTRGRARLLFEMMEGDVLTGGWREPAVKQALDLCLACKGCKGDCPVHVDMASYKAEFLAHYYAGRVRPRHAYAFGLIDRWLTDQADEDFIEVLPMLRRAFGGFGASERRRLMTAVERGKAAGTRAARAAGADDEAAGFGAALPLLFTILGIEARA